MGVSPHASVELFFHECVMEALGRRDVEATDHTEFYLVGLLGEFAHGRISDEPLSVKLAKTKESSPGERFRALKEVGDTSLYLTGFFAESFERKLVNPDYYIGIGEAAYSQLADSLQGPAAIHEVYEELAAKFGRFVDVFQEVRKSVHFDSSELAYLLH